MAGKRGSGRRRKEKWIKIDFIKKTSPIYALGRSQDCIGWLGRAENSRAILRGQGRISTGVSGSHAQQKVKVRARQVELQKGHGTRRGPFLFAVC